MHRKVLLLKLIKPGATTFFLHSHAIRNAEIEATTMKSTTKFVRIYNFAFSAG